MSRENPTKQLLDPAKGKSGGVTDQAVQSTSNFFSGLWGKLTSGSYDKVGDNKQGLTSQAQDSGKMTSYGTMGNGK